MKILKEISENPLQWINSKIHIRNYFILLIDISGDLKLMLVFDLILFVLMSLISNA